VCGCRVHQKFYLGKRWRHKTRRIFFVKEVSKNQRVTKHITDRVWGKLVSNNHLVLSE
jgi:hypothetical protein